jgi:terminal uridylyltransferase
MKSEESNKENSSEMDYLENATVIDESALTPEQRLGLKQAEERLERDHIFRLEKVCYAMLVTEGEIYAL